MFVTATAYGPAPRGSKKAGRAPKRPLHHNPAAVRQARQARGLTQQQLAEKTGRGDTHISEIENGSRDARAELLDLIARVLDCPVEQLRAVGQLRPAGPLHGCTACELTFDPPWNGITPLHLAGDDWCAGGGQQCKAMS